MYGAHSELIVDIALGLGAAVMTLVIALMTYVVVLRIIFLARRRRRERFMAEWRQRLAPFLRNGFVELPRPDRADYYSFLLLWNELFDAHAANPAAMGGLRRALQETRMERVAGRRLRTGRLRWRLMAAVTLGRYGSTDAWTDLEHHARSRHDLLALVASRALMSIDAARATPAFIRQAASRVEWPVASVAEVLAAAGPAVVTAPLAAAVRGADGDPLERLLPYLETCERHTAVAVAREVLAKATEERIVVRALRILGWFRSVEDRHMILGYLRHPRWHVRARVAWCLGRLAVPGDESALQQLVGDEQWWVRYRAAQALADFPGVDRAGLLRLRMEQEDRYGRDILAHVIAERG